ncbi:MAG: hypothetical protein CVU18_17130 [Betaproteobacteria bacterium HGW-Betaproteobacteria-12]|nr:MAG: hypothetical protein CVU18_17130 [Betaproteobacteria bacterium HGW-Betaproteobacteria-12]
MYLVNSPEAADFMVGMGSETRRKVALGDKAKFQGTAAFNHISSAHNAVAEGIPKIAALAQDPTRTLVDQHHAARHVANGIYAVITQAQAGLEAEGRAFTKEGSGLINSVLVLDPSRNLFHNRILDWIEVQAGKPDGIKQIREAAKDNSEFVALLSLSPGYISALSASTRENIVEDGLQRFAPEGLAKIRQGQELTALAGKYAKFAKMLPVYTYNRELADQGNRRVEI